MTVLLLWTAAACSEGRSAHERWQQERAGDLKKEDGWLNLAGLYWLQPGENTFGTGAGDLIRFPEGKAAGRLGVLVLDSGRVLLKAEPGMVRIADTTVVAAPVFPYGKTPIVMAHGSLRWFIIQRGNRFAVRLRDLDHPAVSQFDRIPVYPYARNWAVDARFEPSEGVKLPILDVTGARSEQPSPGRIHFTLNGTSYSLAVLDEDSTTFFVIFADPTNREETYGSGRYLYVDKPLPGTTRTRVDFNRAINPPCAFTDYATCPLPPPGNRLDVPVTAGEKRPAMH